MNKKTFDNFIKELQNPNSLTVSRRSEILHTIYDRVKEIWKCILESANADLKWWAFDNDVEYGDGNGSSGGEFDPNLYKDWVGITGAWRGKLYRFEYGFPTNLLYDDNFSKTIKNAIEEDKRLESDRKEKIKQSAQRARAKKKVLEKLSKLPLEKLEKILEENT